MAAVAVVVAASACAGPSSSVPSGFGGGCATGPVLGGTAGMGVSNDGWVTDVDANILMNARTDGGCMGISLESDE